MNYPTRPTIYFLLLFLTLSFVLSSQSSDCGFDQHFESAKANTPSFQKQNNAYEKAYQQYMHAEENRSYRSDEFLNLPLVFHIVHESDSLGSIGNPRDEAIFQAIDYANQFFRQTDTDIVYQNPYYGADTEISFCIASEAPDETPTLGIVRYAINEGDFFNITNVLWDRQRYINVVIREENNNCGSYKSGTDNIIIADRCLSYKNVLPHELGHYLSLRHIFIREGSCDNQDCLSEGDFVCDTPPHESSTAFTQTGFAGHPCSHPGNSCQSDEDDTSDQNPYRSISLGGLGDQPDPNNNIMSYTGICVSTFTLGQTARMKFNLTEERKNLRAFTSGCGGDIVFENDVSIDKIFVSQSDGCGKHVNIQGELWNHGTANVSSVEILVLESNIVLDTLNWTGLVRSGESVSFTVENVPTIFGLNHFELKAQNPNATLDANPSNNRNSIKYSYKNIRKEIIGEGASLSSNNQVFMEIGVDLSGDEDKFHFLWRRENGSIEQDQQGKPIILVSQADQYFLEIYNEDYICSWAEEVFIEEIDSGDTYTSDPYIRIFNDISCREPETALWAQGVRDYHVDLYTRDGLFQEDFLFIVVDTPGEYRIKTTHMITGEVGYSEWYTVLDFRDSISIDLEANGEISCMNSEVRIEAIGAEVDFSDYTFIWKDLRDGGRIISEDAISYIDVNQPGRYGLEIQNKSRPFSCKVQKEIEVYGADEVPINLIKLPEQFDFANTDTIRLDATQSTQGENFSYQWSTDRGEILDGVNSLNPLVRGYAKYTLELKSISGDCIQSNTIDLVPSHVIDISIICGSPYTTENNKVILTIEGRNDFRIDAVWTFPTGEVVDSNSIGSVRTLKQGKYSVTYFNGIDTIHDSVVIDQELTERPIPHIEEVDDISCLNEESVLSAVNSTYTEGDFFIWRESVTNRLIGEGKEIKVKGSGTYTLEVKNQRSLCRAIDSERVRYEPSDIMAMAGPDIFANCTQDTIIGLNVEEENLEFKWFYLEENDTVFLEDTPKLQVNKSGIYLLELYDQNVNCFSYDEVEVIFNEVDINIGSRTISDTCLNYNEILFVENLGNYFNYDIVWTLPNGEVSANFFQPATQTGTYRVDFFSTNSSCRKSDFFDYTPIQDLGIDIASQDVSCFGADDGKISAMPVGGVPPYTWSNEDYGQLNILRGSYTYSLTDAMGCSVVHEVFIDEPSMLEVSQILKDANGLSIDVSGGSPPYTYLWNTGSTYSLIQNPISTQSYEVTVTDTNGCTVNRETVYIESPNKRTVILVPNPTSDNIQIITQSDDPVEEIKIYNTLGVCVKTIQDYKSRDMIDVSQFTSGVYLAVLSGKSLNDTAKFVKE